MKAKGLFMYKSLQERGKGSFTNKETGDVIEYGACYILVADEIEESGKITERRFKIDIENRSFAEEFLVLNPYTKIELVFDVTLYNANAKITPVSFEIVE